MQEEAWEIIEKLHGGECEPQMKGRMLAKMVQMRDITNLSWIKIATYM